MQKTFSKEFKFKVAMEAIKGDLTIAEIISKYGVAKTSIHEWRKVVTDQGANLFGKKKDVSSDKQIDNLHKIIGKLQVEYEWLKLRFIPNVERLKKELQDFISWYNNERPHQSLNYLTPEEMICGFMERSYDLSNQDLEH